MAQIFINPSNSDSLLFTEFPWLLLNGPLQPQGCSPYRKCAEVILSGHKKVPHRVNMPMGPNIQLFVLDLSEFLQTD